jgi:predicted O-methyltransferase YrrM
MAHLGRALQYPHLWFTLSDRIRNLRERVTVDDWVEFAFHSPFVPDQLRDEIAAFIEQIAARRPQAVLEVGTEMGGTLFLLTLAASPDATIISVDMPVRGFGGYPRWKAAYFRRFALPSQQLHLLRANSHSFATLQGVRALLVNRPLDVLFIDGDHSYGGVRADWEMYGPLVAPGGVVAFHDIVLHPPATGCDVHVFWQELKKEFSHQEIVADSRQSWGGIGMIWVRKASGSSTHLGHESEVLRSKRDSTQSI